MTITAGMLVLAMVDPMYHPESNMFQAALCYTAAQMTGGLQMLVPQLPVSTQPFSGRAPQWQWLHRPATEHRCGLLWPALDFLLHCGLTVPPR